MAKYWLTDDYGEGIWVKLRQNNENNTRYMGLFFKENLVYNIPNFPLRKDDIILSTYTASGTHWLWENMRFLMDAEIKHDKVEKKSAMMEKAENLDELPSPRILNNHGFFEDQPRDLLKGDNKLVLLYRNPKDLAYSLYQLTLSIPELEYKGTFSRFQKRFLKGKVFNGSYFEYLQSFEQGLKTFSTIPHLLIRYEDLHQNPILERRRLANFLGKNYSDEFLQSVVDATSIDTMRTLKTNSPSFYRKGKVGVWRNHFTAEERDSFDKAVDIAMSDSEMFEFKYDLNG